MHATWSNTLHLSKHINKNYVNEQQNVLLTFERCSSTARVKHVQITSCGNTELLYHTYIERKIPKNSDTESI